MLLTDSDFLTAAMLSALEPETAEIASTGDIILEGDGSIIRSAWDECADQLLENMDSFGGYLSGSIGGTTAMFGTSRARVFLSQIVATEAQYANRVSVLQRWMLYKALYLLYRTAAKRTVHDRYSAKADEYAEEIKGRWRSLWVKGLPIVAQPLAAPGAIHEVHSGTWTDANLSTVAAGVAASGVWEVAITYVDGSRYASAAAKGNAESGPGKHLTITVPANNVIRIDIGSLNPPSGAAGTSSDGVIDPLQATGWNVYAGAGGALYLQNGSPIPVTSSQFQFPGAPVLAGAALEPGQIPDANFAFSRILHRA